MIQPDRIELKKDGAHYFLDRLEVTEEVYRDRYPLPKGGGVFMTASKKGWPYASTSVGCHPRDRKKFMEHARSIGVPTTFNSQGQAVFLSSDHQRRYCQATGRVNFDANWSGKGPVAPSPGPKKRIKLPIRDRSKNGFTQAELAEAAVELKKAKSKSR